jgi:hypothetical protein
MKSAALGIRMHSGWGVLVAVNDTAEVLDRWHIVIVSDKAPGGKMPFHHAEKFAVAKAEKYLAVYTTESESLAQREIAKAIDDLKTRGYRLIAAGLVLASGKPLPGLAKILASHPLIHTAEGELFRNVARRAVESVGVSVFGYRERELADRAGGAFAETAPKMIQELADAGKTIGPPWTADHKCAALAACLAMRERAGSP